MKSEDEILALIGDDLWMMMGVVRAVRQLQLPYGWVGAGFVRRVVWDTLHVSRNLNL